VTWHWGLDFKDALVMFVMWMKFYAHGLLHGVIMRLICLNFGLLT